MENYSWLYICIMPLKYGVLEILIIKCYGCFRIWINLKLGELFGNFKLFFIIYSL